MWTAAAVTVGSIFLLIDGFRRGGGKASEPTSEDRFAFLEWTGNGTCFCRSTIRVDLTKLEPTPETIGAIFGLPRVDKICITSEDGTTMKLIKGTPPSWQLKAGNTYKVVYDSNDVSPCSIHEIYSFLGENEEQIHKMSLAFYTRIWEDDKAPDFQSHFTRSVKSPQEAADNQARWLIEMWGGPQRYTEKDGDGLVERRMLAKHSSKRRMTYGHACTWLDYMQEVVNQVYADNKEVKLVLGLYWRHFFGFFAMDEEERIGIRKKALGDGK